VTNMLLSHLLSDHVLMTCYVIKTMMLLLITDVVQLDTSCKCTATCQCECIESITEGV